MTNFPLPEEITQSDKQSTIQQAFEDLVNAVIERLVTGVSPIKANQIDEATSGNGINVGGVINKDGEITTSGDINIHDSSPKLYIRDTNNLIDDPGVTGGIFIQDSAGTNIAAVGIHSGVNGDLDIANFIPDANIDISTVGEGKLRIGTQVQAAQGVSFDGGANVLETYKEGEFTPTLYGAGVAGTQTFTRNSGVYHRIGNMVFFNIVIEMSAKDALMSGGVVIGGLPFTVRNSVVSRTSCVIGRISDLNLATNAPVSALTIHNTDTITLYEQRSSGSLSTIDSSEIESTFQIYLSGSYPI